MNEQRKTLPADLRLDDRVAVVTGGSGGMGRATTQRLEESGRACCGCRPACRDPTLIFSVRPMLAIEARHGARLRGRRTRTRPRHDSRCNCAGSRPACRSAHGDNRRFWSTVMGVNLTGTLHLYAGGCPANEPGRWGRDLNIASLAGKAFRSPSGVSYSASKAGVIALTRQVGGELISSGIRVNCVCPGPTDTAMAHDGTTDAAYRSAFASDTAWASREA